MVFHSHRGESNKGEGAGGKGVSAGRFWAAPGVGEQWHQLPQGAGRALGSPVHVLASSGGTGMCWFVLNVSAFAKKTTYIGRAPVLPAAHPSALRTRSGTPVPSDGGLGPELPRGVGAGGRPNFLTRGKRTHGRLCVMRQLSRTGAREAVASCMRIEGKRGRACGERNCP